MMYSNVAAQAGGAGRAGAHQDSAAAFEAGEVGLDGIAQGDQPAVHQQHQAAGARAQHSRHRARRPVDSVKYTESLMNIKNTEVNFPFAAAAGAVREGPARAHR